MIPNFSPGVWTILERGKSLTLALTRLPEAGATGVQAVGSQVQRLVGREPAAADCVSTLHYARDTRSIS